MSSEESNLLLSINEQLGKVWKGQGILGGDIKIVLNKIDAVGKRQDELEFMHEKCSTAICDRMGNVEEKLKTYETIKKRDRDYRSAFFSLITFLLGLIGAYSAMK